MTDMQQSGAGGPAQSDDQNLGSESIGSRIVDGLKSLIRGPSPIAVTGEGLSRDNLNAHLGDIVEIEGNARHIPLKPGGELPQELPYLFLDTESWSVHEIECKAADGSSIKVTALASQPLPDGQVRVNGILFPGRDGQYLLEEAELAGK